nr:hypothetical protein [Thiorhodovibrio winogradskyi]
MEEDAEFRITTATRQLATAERALRAAIGDRRAARDRLGVTASAGLDEAARERLGAKLDLARLRELLARARLAAVDAEVELARAEDDLSEARQALLSARIAFLEPRVKFARDDLERRLAELRLMEDDMRARIEDLQRGSDKAESALYLARRRLAAAIDEERRAAASEWVAARQAEIEAARFSVDAMLSALANLERTRALWELRYQVMNASDAVDAPERLRELIEQTMATRAAKEVLEGRLNRLRSIQLAQTRRLREPDMSEDTREALAVRGAAHDLAELHAREWLETEDALIALQQSTRVQLEALVDAHQLSLTLLQARETLSTWWDIELIVIDDQSIGARELVAALAIFALDHRRGVAAGVLQVSDCRAGRRARYREPGHRLRGAEYPRRCLQFDGDHPRQAVPGR